jgi:hypothetical protein
MTRAETFLQSCTPLVLHLVLQDLLNSMDLDQNGSVDLQEYTEFVMQLVGGWWWTDTYVREQLLLCKHQLWAGLV